ncbi:MAG: hypothetical protein KGI45_03880 [Patescibacteria group bacterium]|nr:hypothetical protein [Patescibacteria group bacterium]MDE1941225.1 hypothetical protein [Patescibacteria group bacterium]MDE1967174.1 hypothetical protein [Patescibacteria group bacterium]
MTAAYDLANEHRRQIVCSLLIASSCLAAIYVLNIYSVVSKTVALQRTEKQIASLSQGVEDLDSQYLALSSKITPDSLKEYGLSQVQVSEYISRSSTLGVSQLAVSGGHEL